MEECILVDLRPFQANIEAAMSRFNDDCDDPRSSFSEMLTSIGYQITSQIELGKIVRVSGPNEKQHKKSAWYIFQEYPTTDNKVIGVGSYGSWKAGEKQTWCSRSQTTMNTQERLEYYNHIEKARIKHEQEQVLINDEAALKAFDIWNKAELTGKTGYLEKKKIKAYEGVRFSRGSLVIPVVTDNKITSLQFIPDYGDKRFLTGGRVKGCYFVIQGTVNRVFVVEGYATGASVHEATGATVYISFNAGNLYEVTSIAKKDNQSSKIIIASDDDQFGDNNAGKDKANQVSSALGVDVVFPTFKDLSTKPTDFNDLHCLEGMSSVKKQLINNFVETYQKNETKKEEDITTDRPEGVLGEIYDYYNATSGNDNKSFSIQTSLAICSIVTARSYKSTDKNLTNLYFLNVARSCTGKEHSKTVIETILKESGLNGLISGDGYTSAGAVFSALLRRPKHITVIDEFGRYLEAGKNSSSSIQQEANTKLMEAVGRPHGTMRPPTYSTMTLKKDAADALENRVIENPSIVMLVMTTPDRYFDAIDMSAVKDGFVGRFITSISDKDYQLYMHKQSLPVPQSIIEWIKKIESRAGITHIATESPSFIEMIFMDDAKKIQLEFQSYCQNIMRGLEKFGMQEVAGRYAEFSMRVAMILALAKDPMAKYITIDEMKWGIAYIKSCMDKMISCLKVSVSSSDHESNKKEVLFALRALSPEWIKRSEMIKTQPFSKHNKKYLDELLEELLAADLIDDRMSDTTGKRGRPTKEYVALN